MAGPARGPVRGTGGRARGRAGGSVPSRAGRGRGRVDVAAVVASRGCPRGARRRRRASRRSRPPRGHPREATTAATSTRPRPRPARDGTLPPARPRARPPVPRTGPRAGPATRPPGPAPPAVRTSSDASHARSEPDGGRSPARNTTSKPLRPRTPAPAQQRRQCATALGPYSARERVGQQRPAAGGAEGGGGIAERRVALVAPGDQHPVARAAERGHERRSRTGVGDGSRYAQAGVQRGVLRREPAPRQRLLNETNGSPPGRPLPSAGSGPSTTSGSRSAKFRCTTPGRPASAVAYARHASARIQRSRSGALLVRADLEEPLRRPAEQRRPGRSSALPPPRAARAAGRRSARASAHAPREPRPRRASALRPCPRCR